MPYSPTIASFFTDVNPYGASVSGRTRTGVSSSNYDRNNTIATLTTLSTSSTATTATPSLVQNSASNIPQDQHGHGRVPQLHAFPQSLRTKPLNHNTNSPRSHFRISLGNLTKCNWTCFRTDEITPYVCLKGNLVQLCFNKLTLAFVVLAVVVHMFGSLVLWNLRYMQSYELANCLSASTNQELLQVTKNSLTALNTQELNIVNTTLANTYQFVLGQMEVLEMGYKEALTNSISAAANSATNVTDILSGLVEKNIDAANETVSSELETLTSALEKLASSLSETNVFSSNGLGSSAKNISLEPFFFDIPSSINTGLLSANASSFQNNMQMTLSYVKSNAIKDVDQIYAEYHATVSYILATVSNTTDEIADGISNSCDTIGIYYDKSLSSVDTSRKSCLIVLLVLAVAAMIPAAVNDHYSWRRTLDVGQLVETNMDHCPDAVSCLMEAKSPTVWKLASLVTNERLNIQRKMQPLVRWLFCFQFSARAMSLLFLSMLFMLLYICEKGIIRATKNHSITVDGTYSEQYMNTTSWASALDTKLLTLQLSLNQNITSLFTRVARQTYDTLAVFTDDLQTNASALLKNTNILAPQMSYSVGSKIHYATLNYPSFQDETGTSLSNITGIVNVESPNNLDLLIKEFDYIASTNLTISIVLVTIWVFMFLITLHYVAYRKFQS